MRGVCKLGLAAAIFAILQGSLSCGGGGGTAASSGAGGSSSAAQATSSATTSGSVTSSGSSASSGQSSSSGGTFGGNPSSICSPVPANGDMTAGPFAAPASAPAGASFLSDWPKIPKSGGYRYTQLMDACRMQLDGTMTWHGSPSLRVEVQPGDDPLGLGSERAEVLIMQDGAGNIYENTTSGTQYYATSYYFPKTWDATFLQGDADSWSFVFQLYGASALSAGRHHSPGPQIYQLAAGNQTYDFSAGSLALGQWTDLVFMYTWATTATGHITVWRRDEGQMKFQQVLDVGSIATLPSSDPTAYYWKQGLYRGPDVSGRVDVFWIGPTARGASFAAVESAAFGTSAGP